MGQNISIVIATNRPQSSLRATVSSIARQELGALKCELLVVHNGSSTPKSAPDRGSNKKELIEVKHFYEARAGKSRALNWGLKKAHGELIAFTDDDVVVSSKWLVELQRAAQLYPDESVFCGPVIPRFPNGTPRWLRQHSYSAEMFGNFTPALGLGPLPIALAPVGANFAVRASALDGLRFRTDLGASDEHGPLCGEDTAFLQELHLRFFVFTKAGGIVYVPTAGVHHRVQKEKTRFPQIMERFFHVGRSHVLYYQRLSHYISNIDSARRYAVGNESQRLTTGIVLNFYCGQLFQYGLRRDESQCRYLKKLLLRLDVRKHKKLLSRSARNLLVQHCL